MFKLESNRLKREFKIANNTFYASQIQNKYSDMSFVPDGNSSEFVIYFTDGTQFSSKGLPVVSSSEENGKLRFDFVENKGVSVTLEYWIHNDGNTICKQLTLSQSDDRIIDSVLLENVGIVNSKTHFGVDIVSGSEIPEYHAMLGQPFYIDSLFFGCEFPATDNRIIHGTGQIRYYIGKNIGKDFKCPLTVMGGGKDNTIVEVHKAFFEYIDFISVGTELRFQYNSWYDNMEKISEEGINNSFIAVKEALEKHDAPRLDSYVVDDGWVNYRAKFWEFNKAFPNKMKNISKLCSDFDSGLGLWLSPRGGYRSCRKFAKRIQRSGNGFLNSESKDICIASQKYIDKLSEFLISTANELNINYLKLDGFSLSPCKNENHDHIVGGENDMYFITDMWQKWIRLFEKLRASRDNLWINMTCYVNPSPWWLQWVNSIWLQNSDDIGFSNNLEEQPQLEAEITYRDERYYDCVIRRSNSLPLKAIYNHEPIYGKAAKVNYSNDEFKKYLYWCAIRGQALNELYLSPDIMNDEKWNALSEVMKFQKKNYHILKNASFIGGSPEDNNIYGYISWTEAGEGIIALRNPTKDKTSLTITFNKLMGVPEDFENARRENIFCLSNPETDRRFSYNEKLDLTLHPFEIMILKFTK